MKNLKITEPREFDGSFYKQIYVVKSLFTLNHSYELCSYEFLNYYEAMKYYSSLDENPSHYNIYLKVLFVTKKNLIAVSYTLSVK